MGLLRGFEGRCPCLDTCLGLARSFAYGSGPAVLTGRVLAARIGAVPTALIGCHPLRYITTMGPLFGHVVAVDGDPCANPRRSLGVSRV